MIEPFGSCGVLRSGCVNFPQQTALQVDSFQCGRRASFKWTNSSWQRDLSYAKGDSRRADWSVLGNIYAPNDEGERASFWDELKDLRDGLPAPWILGGDFNSVRQPEEKVGSIFNFPAMQCFSNFINNLNLIDLPLTGARFTWGRLNANPSYSKLDRFLIHAEVLMIFPDLLQIAKPRSLSDHNPVVLEFANVNWGPKPFKFYNHWYDRKGFQSFIKEEWDEVTSAGRDTGEAFTLSLDG